jgi:two-component system chemotaxis response regulator CheB
MRERMARAGRDAAPRAGRASVTSHTLERWPLAGRSTEQPTTATHPFSLGSFTWFSKTAANRVADAAAQARDSRQVAVGSRQEQHSRLTLAPAAMAGHGTAPQLVAIGASTGGTEVLKQLLDAMPADAPSMVIVQHMPEQFTAAFARRLNETSAMTVREAAPGDIVRAGTALIAPGDRHMTLVAQGRGTLAVALHDGPLVNRHRPSVDVLFSSAARALGAAAIGVLLTGMGRDGAKGLLEMRKAGALTMAQDEASSIVFGMPRAAIELGAAARVLAADRIGTALLDAVKGDND